MHPFLKETFIGKLESRLKFKGITATTLLTESIQDENCGLFLDDELIRVIAEKDQQGASFREIIDFLKTDDRANNRIRTASGRVINLFEPELDNIELIDIAWGLSNMCRFSGQVKRFLSVAEHSCGVFDSTQKEHPNDRELWGIALLHDASEAYIGDLIRPVKLYNPNYIELEENLQRAILSKFGLPSHRMGEIKKFDMQQLAIEQVDRCGKMSIETAQNEFFKRAALCGLLSSNQL